MSQPTLNEDLNVVANSDLEITYMDGDLNIIQALDDEPNDVGGLTSAELKAKFDEAGNKIKTYINETLIPEILSEDATEAARAAAEAQREANESQRIENENARIAAEQARVDETNGIVAQAAAQAQAAAESAAQAKQIAIGDIPDGTFPESKLTQDVQDAIDRAKVGGEIDTTLANKPDKNSVVNPNLLDNWYFAYPVNQRNVSGTIDTVGYFLDRWKLVSGSVTIGSNGITLNGTIVQILEAAVGTDVTASALTTEGVVDASYDNNSKTFSLTGTGQTFAAAKLELGSTQTLAHQDENGNWVLNEIPNYGEQLARCQRYFWKPDKNPSFGESSWILRGIATSQTHMDIYNGNVPVTMRVYPTATNWKFRDGTTGEIFSVPSPEYSAVTKDGVVFVGNLGRNLTVNRGYNVYVELSADL